MHLVVLEERKDSNTIIQASHVHGKEKSRQKYCVEIHEMYSKWCSKGKSLHLPHIHCGHLRAQVWCNLRGVVGGIKEDQSSFHFFSLFFISVGGTLSVLHYTSNKSGSIGKLYSIWAMVSYALPILIMFKFVIITT